jgi:hypothetical protein
MRFRTLVVTEIAALILEAEKITGGLQVLMAVTAISVASTTRKISKSLSVLTSTLEALSRAATMYRAFGVSEVTVVGLTRVKKLLRNLTVTAATAANLLYARVFQRALIVTSQIVVTIGQSVLGALRAILQLLGQRTELELAGDEMGLTLSGSEQGLTLTLEEA